MLYSGHLFITDTFMVTGRIGQTLVNNLLCSGHLHLSDTVHSGHFFSHIAQHFHLYIVHSRGRGVRDEGCRGLIYKI